MHMRSICVLYMRCRTRSRASQGLPRRRWALPTYQLCSPCACRGCCCACASRRACRCCALNLSLASLCSCRSTHFVGGVCRSTRGASVVASASPPPPGAVTALQAPRKSPHRPAAKGQPRPESNQHPIRGQRAAERERFRMLSGAKVTVTKGAVRRSREK